MMNPGKSRFQRTAWVLLLSISLLFAVWPIETIHADKEDELKKKLDDIEKEKGQAQESIKELESKVEERKKKLSEVEQDLQETEDKMDKSEKKLKKAQDNLDRYSSDYKNSVRSMYLNGNSGQMESLLNAESFGQFLSRFEIMRLMVKRDYNVVEKYYKEKEKVKKERDKIAKLQKKKKKEVEKAGKAYQELAEEMNKNREALSSLSQKEVDYRKELKQLNLDKIKVSNAPFQGGGGALSRPVNGRMTSGYGIRGGGEFHTGVDFANSIGTPIYAAGSGKVIRAQTCSCGYGYYIMIDHGGGIYTLYAHSWATQSRVRVGQVVQKGQQIAAIGNNGRSSGPHLHFEVHKGRPGNYVNPWSYIR